MAVVNTGDGGYAIVKAKKHHCQWCPVRSEFLCDYEIEPGRTCDKRMCSGHATRIGPEKDFCPDHVANQGTKAMAKAA